MRERSPFWKYLLITLMTGSSLATYGCGTAGIQTEPTPTMTATPVPTPSAAPTPTPVVDVVAGERLSDRVYIFYDALHTGMRAPDVILDSSTSLIAEPRNVVLFGNRLFVANDGNTNRVMIFDDFVNLSPTDTPEPDVVLDNATSLIDDVEGMAVFGNDLYVANEDADSVTIYRDIDSIVAGGVAVPPDVILDATTSELDDPNRITIADNTLYVCNNGSSTITVYENVDSLVAAVEPSATLEDEINCGIASPLKVFSNVLYAVSSSPSMVTGFLPADALMDSQDPSFILDAVNALVSVPADIFVGEGRVFVANDDSANGVLVFADPIPVIPAATPMPSIMLTDPLEECGGGLDGAVGALFAACNGPDATPAPGVYGYLNAGSIASGASPDIMLTDPSMEDLISLDVQVRP